MANLAEWEAYFKSLPPKRRLGLQKALNTVMNDRMFKKEFGWTGLDALADMLRVIRKYEK